MENLYKMAEETGMSQSQAEAAVGGVFSLIKEHVSEEHFESIAQNVPGLQDVVQKHKDSQTGGDDNDNDDNDNDGGGLAESLLGAFSALSSGGGGATRELFDGNNDDDDEDNNEGTYRSRDGTTTATTTEAGAGGEATQEGASTAASATATSSSSTQSHGQGTSSSTTTGTASASNTHKVGAAAGKNNSIGAVMLESVFSSLAKGKGKGGIVGGLAKLVLFLQAQGVTPQQLATFLPMVAVYVKKQFGVDVSHVLGGPSSSGATSSSSGSSSTTHSSSGGGGGNVAGKLMGMFMK